MSRERLVDEEASEALSLDRDGSVVEGGIFPAILIFFLYLAFPTTRASRLRVPLSLFGSPFTRCPRWTAREVEISGPRDVLEARSNLDVPRSD